ncbi:flavin reductase [Ancylobacter lacus]|uniref:flavin reductase n=1 Tax=Ancylobacter lacus TaxID=2579970 RepID=UPI001BD18A3C|nr:flavin reductase [Ancylobacter lacus]MBS7541006.1 flavin reductase [Ancylobacter lacus]
MLNRVSPPLVDTGALVPPAALDAQAFRAGMSKLAAAVNIITSPGKDEPYGFTASAVCSVTDTPPTLLVCINRSNRSHPVIAASRVLCVNTACAEQGPLSMAFASSGGSMAQRFGQGAWTTMATGAPVLVDAAVSFDCRVLSLQEIGTHDVLFCEVVAIREGGRGGLVYFDRRFHPLG